MRKWQRPSSCMYLVVVAASTLHSSARPRDEHVHPDSASASHRGAAASLLLQQSELDGGSVGGHIAGVWSVLASTAPLHVQAAETSKRTLSPCPPRTVEQPQACSCSRSLMAAPLQNTTIAGAWSRWQAHSSLRVAAAETSTRTLSRRASASHRGAAAHSPSRALVAETSKCTLSPCPHRIVKQPQACCYISRSLMAAPSQKTIHASA